MSLIVTGALANAKNRADFDYLEAVASDTSLDLHALVERLVSYTGFLHPGPYEKLKQRIAGMAIGAGSVSDAVEVFSAPGRPHDAVIRAAGKQRYSYLPEAVPPALEEHVLCEEVPNPHRSDMLPSPISRRLHQPRCPALKYYVGNNLDLFVGPCAFQTIERESGGYVAAASSRPMSSAVFDAPRVAIGRPVVLVQDIFNGYNFAHFLFDWITRVGLLIKSGIVSEKNAVFVFGGLPNDFHRIVIEALTRNYGLRDENIFFPNADVIIRAPRLVFFSDHTSVHGHPAQMFRHEAVDVLRAVIRCADVDRGKPGRRIYISRGDVKRRAVENERALIPLLDRFGMDFVRLADLPMHQQLSLMARAECVVGAHGMGLTLLAFNEHRPDLIELHNPSVGTDAYALMSRGLGFGYTAVVGSEAGGEHFRVELDVLEKVLADRMRPRASALWRAPPRLWKLAAPYVGWFGGAQRRKAEVTVELSAHEKEGPVFLHQRDGGSVTLDSNVGYWQLDKLLVGVVYDFSCDILIPNDFCGKAISLSLPELGIQESADLSMRKKWQTLLVTKTCPEEPKVLNMVLRVASAEPCRVFSSCWRAQPTALTISAANS